MHSKIHGCYFIEHLIVQKHEKMTSLTYVYDTTLSENIVAKGLSISIYKHLVS